MPYDPSAAQVVLVATIEQGTQLLFLKMFLAGCACVSGFVSALIFATTWKG